MPDLLGDLNRFRVDLDAAGLLRSRHYSTTTVAGIIDLDDAGTLVALTPLKIKETYREDVPAVPDRTSAPRAAFLSGTPDYWFGTKRHYQLALHQAVLPQPDGIGAAILAFLAGPALSDAPKSTNNWVVRVGGRFAHADPDLKRAWEAYFVPDPVKNPRVRVMPAEAFIRLGTSSNAASSESYGGNDAFLHLMDPGGAADALNWLLDRPSTARHQDTAIIAWLDGDPYSDPTPFVFPFYRTGDYVRPMPMNTLHVAMLTARPPARMSLHYYWSGDAALAFERIGAFDAALRRGAGHYFTDDRPVRWHEAFRDRPRWAAMVMTVMQAVLNGDRIPDGVAHEIVAILRKPARITNEAYCAALISAWHEEKRSAVTA